MAQRCDIDDVGIFGIGHDSGDRLSFLQSHEGERLPGVRRFVDSRAEGRALTIVGFAGADPDDAGIGLVNCDITDGNHRISIKDRLKGGAVVDGLPQAAGSKSYIEHGRIALHGFDIVNAARHARRSDRTPAKLLEYWIFGLVDGRPGRWCSPASLTPCRCCEQQANHQSKPNLDVTSSSLSFHRCDPFLDWMLGENQVNVSPF